MSVNKVLIIGRLGQNPEVRYTPSGAAVGNFSVATSESWNDKSGQKQERTEWHRVVVWGKTAEHCAQYLTKGRQVYVEGRLQTRQWQDKDGQTKYTTEIQAQTVQFLGSGQNASAGGASAGAPMGSSMTGGAGAGSFGGSSFGTGPMGQMGGQPGSSLGGAPSMASPGMGFGSPSEPSFTEDDIPF